MPDSDFEIQSDFDTFQAFVLFIMVYADLQFISQGFEVINSVNLQTYRITLNKTFVQIR